MGIEDLLKTAVTDTLNAGLFARRMQNETARAVRRCAWKKKKQKGKGKRREEGKETTIETCYYSKNCRKFHAICLKGLNKRERDTTIKFIPAQQWPMSIRNINRNADSLSRILHERPFSRSKIKKRRTVSIHLRSNLQRKTWTTWGAGRATNEQKKKKIGELSNKSSQQ